MPDYYFCIKKRQKEKSGGIADQHRPKVCMLDKLFDLAEENCSNEEARISSKDEKKKPAWPLTFFDEQKRS